MSERKIDDVTKEFVLDLHCTDVHEFGHFGINVTYKLCRCIDHWSSERKSHPFPERCSIALCKSHGNVMEIKTGDSICTIYSMCDKCSKNVSLWLDFVKDFPSPEKITELVLKKIKKSLEDNPSSDVTVGIDTSDLTR